MSIFEQLQLRIVAWKIFAISPTMPCTGLMLIYAKLEWHHKIVHYIFTLKMLSLNTEYLCLVVNTVFLFVFDVVVFVNDFEI